MKKTTPLQTALHVMHHIEHLLSSQDTLTTQGQTPEQHSLEQTTGAHSLTPHTPPKTKRLALRSMALLLLAFLGLGVGEVLGQTTYYFQPSSGNPATVSNWNTLEAGGGTSPANFTGASDIFIIPSGKTAFGTSAWTVTNQVTVMGTIAPTSTSSNNYTAKSWVIESTGIVLLQQTAGIVIATNGTFTCSGLVRFNRSTSLPGSLTLSTGATATMLNGGVWHHQETPGGNIPTMTWEIGSTCRVTRTTSTTTAFPISSLNQEFYNLEWDYNNSSANIFEANPPKFKPGGTLTIKGTGTTGSFGLANTTTARTWTIENLVIEGGIFFIAGASAGATAHQLTLNGNLSVTGGTFHLNRSAASNAAASAPVLNIKGNMNFTGGTLGNGFVTYGIINFNGTDEQIYTGTTALNDTYMRVFVKDGAILFVQKNSFLAGGHNSTSAFSQFVVESGGSLIVGDANGFVNTAYNNSSTKLGAIRMNGTKSYSTSANYGYESDVAQVTGNGLPSTVNNLTMNNTHASGVTLTNNVTVSSNLSIGFGSVFNLATNTLGGSTLTTSGTGKLQTQNTTATPIPAGRTWSFEVEMNANSAQTVPQGNYATLRLNTGGTKTISDNTAIAGDLIVENATATVGNNIAFSGSYAQSIAGLAYNNIAFSNAGTKTFTLNASVSPTSAITFSGTPGTVDFDGTSNNLEFVLQSTVNGTARVGNASGWALNGQLRAERFVPAKRSWRLLTAPLKGNANNSIYANWQGSTNEGLLLWHPQGGGDTGLAVGPQSNIWSYTGTGWASVTNTNTANLYDGSTNNAYLIFATGSFGSQNISSGADATTIRAKGALITGDKDYSLIANQFKLIGNPYASPINTEVMVSDLANSGSKIWLLDPTNGLGAYVTYDGTNWSVPTPSGNDKYIQSGQAFFIRRNSNTFTVKESHKVAGNSNTWFERNANNETNLENSDRIRLLLYKQDTNNWLFADGALAVNSSNGNNNVDDTDATKISNFNESLFLRNGTTNLSIEYRALPQLGDIQALRLTGTTNGSYQLRLYTENYTNSTIQPYLEDTQTTSIYEIPTDGSEIIVPFEGVVSNSSNPITRFRLVYQSTLDTQDPTKIGVSIYPNPVDEGYLTISLDNNLSATTYALTNLLGQEVQRGNLMLLENVINVNKLPKGVYFITIKQNEKNYSKKIIFN